MNKERSNERNIDREKKKWRRIEGNKVKERISIIFIIFDLII